MFITQSSSRSTLAEILSCVLLLFLMAQISIPLQPVPITLQTLGVMLIGLKFNRRTAFYSVLTIASKVISDPNTQIEVVGNLDSICSACPNQTKQGECTTQAKVLQLDRRHMEILGIKIGEALTWNEAIKKIREKMSLKKFDYACEGCNWQPYGICKDALLNCHSYKGS